jgi:hypothetical protein
MPDSDIQMLDRFRQVRHRFQLWNMAMPQVNLKSVLHHLYGFASFARLNVFCQRLQPNSFRTSVGVV